MTPNGVLNSIMAEYPNLDAPVPDPRNIALRECIAAMRAAMPLIATPPDRAVLKAVARRAEDVLG